MHFDVVVVGGGIIGRATALQLLRAGLSVAIVYPHHLVHGQASAAAGAMFGVFSEVSSHDAPERQALDVHQRWLARELYSDWLADLTERSDLPVPVTSGLFVIANPVGEHDSQELAAIRAAARSLRREAQSVPSSDVPGLAPHRASRAFDALFLPDEGSVDTGRLLQALDLALRADASAALIDGSVDRLSLETPHVRAHLDTGSTLSADAIVLASGAALPHLLRHSNLLTLGLPHVFSGRGVSLRLRSGVSFPHPVRTPNRGFACGLHIVPRSNAETYLGATNRFSTTPDFDRHATLDELNTLLLGGIQEINTHLKFAELVSVAVGHRPVTIDRLPVVGRAADPRILVATGAYRNGILLAPLVARLIADEVQSPGIHRDHPFAPSRPTEVGASLPSHTWLHRASASLVDFILQPGGHLPDHRAEDLQKFIQVMLSLALDPESDPALVLKLQRLLNRAPMEENLPLIFDTVIRHA